MSGGRAIWTSKRCGGYAKKRSIPLSLGGAFGEFFRCKWGCFTGQFGQSKVDPRSAWPRRVRVRPRRNAAFVVVRSSGHSNPMGAIGRRIRSRWQSGAGAEFTLATTEAGDWAIRMLQSMLAFDILLRAGRFPGKQHLGLNRQDTASGAAEWRPCLRVANLVHDGAGGHSDRVSTLPSGKVLLAGFTAISDDELKEAKKQRLPGLIDRLRCRLPSRQ